MPKQSLDANFAASMEDFSRAMDVVWHAMAYRLGIDPQEAWSDDEDSIQNAAFVRLCQIMLDTPAARDVGKPDYPDPATRAAALPGAEEIDAVATATADEVFEIFVLDKYRNGRSWDAVRDTVADYARHLLAEKLAGIVKEEPVEAEPGF